MLGLSPRRLREADPQIVGRDDEITTGHQAGPPAYAAPWTAAIVTEGKSTSV